MVNITRVSFYPFCNVLTPDLSDKRGLNKPQPTVRLIDAAREIEKVGKTMN